MWLKANDMSRFKTDTKCSINFSVVSESQRCIFYMTFAGKLRSYWFLKFCLKV